MTKDDNNNKDLRRVKLSEEGPLASADMCYPAGGKKPWRQRWCDSHDLFVDKGGRVFALVAGQYGDAYMDAVTGSLYDRKSGRCYSSDRLRVGRLTRDRELARQILSAMKIVKFH